MKNLYEFINEKELKDNILLFPITSEEIEYIAGKKLSKKYLNRVFISLTCDIEVQNLIQKAMKLAVKYSLNDSGNSWVDIDERYRKLSTRTVKKSKV